LISLERRAARGGSATPPGAMAAVKVDYLDSAFLPSDSTTFLSVGDITGGLDGVDGLLETTAQQEGEGDSQASPWAGWETIRSYVWSKAAQATGGDGAGWSPAALRGAQEETAPHEKRGTPTASGRSVSSTSSTGGGDEPSASSTRCDEPAVAESFAGQISSLLVHTALLIGRGSLRRSGNVVDEGEEEEEVSARSGASASFQMDIESESDSDSFREEVADHGLPYEETVYGVTCRDEFRKLSMYVRHRRVEHLTAIFKIP